MNYFDHAASTFIYPQVLEVLNQSFRDDFANPNSKHQLGANLLLRIESARAYFLETLGAKKDDFFFFTSSATESNNTIVAGLDFKKGDIILYSKADHPSLVEPIEKIAHEKCLELKAIKHNSDGTIDQDEFKRILSDKVKFVALTHINSQSGVITDLNFFGKLIKNSTQAHLHVDAAQSFSKIDLNVYDYLDSVSITSHKIGGPKGIAGLYLKKDHLVKPLLLGGGQENGFRSSTQALPLILAFKEASKISFSKKEQSFSELMIQRNFLEESLKNLIPQINSPFKNTSPYILSFILPGIPSDVILRHLETKGFYLSSTSACSSKQKGFNPTLAALNISENFHKFVLRISFGHDTSSESVKLLLKAMSDVWNDLKFLTKK